MPSNTSKGRGGKGSRFWIQTLVNLDKGKALSKAIRAEEPTIGKIIFWKSPLKYDYEEMETKDIKEFSTANLDFWPKRGPSWDAVGVDDKGTVLLVEAKANIDETISHCGASDAKSIDLIIASMTEAHNCLAPHHKYPPKIWFEECYQLGNRLTHLVKLREQGFKVKLILLNFVNDTTYKPTSEEEWKAYYKETFAKMLGTTVEPMDVVVVNFEV